MTLDQVLALQRRRRRRSSTRATRPSSPPRTSPAASTSASAASTRRGPAPCSSREQPIVIIADPGREHEAAMRLGRIGFDHVVGYLKDGLHSLESRPELTASTERLSAPLAAERLAARTRRRSSSTCARRGERAAEAHRRQRRHPAQPSGGARWRSCRRDRPLLVYCAGGYRSSIAASLLQQHGFDAGQRDRRRHRRVGSGEAADGATSAKTPRFTVLKARPPSAPGSIAFRIFATTVKFGSTTLAISYSVAWPINVCAPRSVKP